MKFFRKRAKTELSISDQTLAKAKVGQILCIKQLHGTCCDKLRSMGFCESITVTKLSHGRNMLCLICGTKVAIHQELAAQIFVSPA